MAIAKRGSRTITVDGVEYRWAVSEDSGYKVVVVQHESGSGQRLEVPTPYSENFVDLAIGPGIVARLIHLAIAEGWVPTDRQPAPMRMDAADDTFAPSIES